MRPIIGLIPLYDDEKDSFPGDTDAVLPLCDSAGQSLYRQDENHEAWRQIDRACSE